MANLHFAAVTLLGVAILFPLTYGLGLDHQWKKQKLIDLEHLTTSTKSLPLISDHEKKANNIIMNFKKKDYDVGFKNPNLFLPFLKFHKAKKSIAHSVIYKILKKFPKGSNLYTKLDAMLSFDEFVKFTYLDNLFACKKHDDLYLKFMRKEKDDKECDWTSVKKLRKDDSDAFDEVLRKIITMSLDSFYETNPEKVEEKLKDRLRVVGGVSRYLPVFKMYVNRSLYELYDDNIFYTEIRSDLPTLYDLDGNVYTEFHTAKLIYEGAKDFASTYPKFYGARLIYTPCINNKSNIHEHITMAEKLKEEFPDFLAGVDFSSCNNDEANLENMKDHLNKLKKKDIHLFSQSGRSVYHGCDDQALYDAIFLGIKRLGGAESILKHPEVLKLIKLKHTPIEVLPISSQVLNYINRIPNHPAAYLIVNDHPVIIGNDRPLLFGSKGVSFDWYELFMGIASKKHDLKLLKQLALNSIEHSSMPLKEKLIAVNGWHKCYDEFIDWIGKADLTKRDEKD